MESKVLKSISAKCDNCGSAMAFDPNSQNLRCDKCESIKLLPKTKRNEKHNIEEANGKKRTFWTVENKILKCDTCGAQLILNNLEYSGICPYCGSNYVSEIKNLPDFTPDIIVPFTFDRDEAQRRFIIQVKHKFFVPTACKKNLKPEEIKGTYIPAFSFDAFVNANYSGRLAKTGKDGSEHFSIKGNHKAEFKDLLIENSSKITQANLKSILPYDTSKAYDFSESFILGYVVEHYEQAFKSCCDLAVQEMEKQVKEQILKKYDYNIVESFNLNCDISNKKYYYGLVPIYQINFNYKDKKYNILMNGQSGKIGGKFPRSGFKIFLVVFFWISVILLLVGLCALI